MLQALEETVAKRYLGCEPGVGLRIPGVPTCHQVSVAIVSGELHKAGSAPSRNVSRRYINRVIALTNIEGPAIHRYTLDDGRDQEVGVGISVSVGVSGKIVRVEEIADLKELRDRLTVIA